jgi:dolichol-phosphate mannosyltransferase
VNAEAEALAPAPDAPPRVELSLVICTLDEAEAIGPLLDETGNRLSGLAYELIVVDDSAGDATAAVVLARAAADPRIRLLHRQGARGLASAAIAGWDAARGRLIGLMDGDGQHDPQLIAQMTAPLAATGDGAPDLVLASRYMHQGGTGLAGLRNAISRVGTAMTHLLLGVRVSDPLSGCFLMRREWYEAVRPRLTGIGFKILLDVLASGRRRPVVREVPTALRPRDGGVSKLDLRVIADFVALLLEKRSGGLLSARLALFLMVGASGVAVHLAVLSLVRALGAPFWAAQGAAILTAMTTNFFANNALTFRDMRLRGRRLVGGLASFYLACLGGAAISEVVGIGLHAGGAGWIAAGLAGAVAGALWNYQTVQLVTWRRRRAQQHAGAGTATPAIDSVVEAQDAQRLASEGAGGR